MIYICLGTHMASVTKFLHTSSSSVNASFKHSEVLKAVIHPMESYPERLSITAVMYLLFMLTFNATIAELFTPSIFLLLNSLHRR